MGHLTPAYCELEAPSSSEGKGRRKKFPDPGCLQWRYREISGFQELDEAQDEDGRWALACPNRSVLTTANPRLTDRALKHMTTWEAMVMATNDATKLTVEKWEEELTLAFGNAQIKAQSQRKWHALEQGATRSTPISASQRTC